MNEAKNIHERDVIIIEDSLSVAILIRDFLNKLGYQNIHTCENGASGIRVFEEFVKAGNLPLIFLDYGLPDMKGDEVLDKILSIRPDVKIILETASEETDAIIKDAIRRGAYNYLGKPIRFENVKNIMDTFEKENAILQHPEPATRKQLEALVTKKTPIFNLKTIAVAILITSVVTVVFLSLFAYQSFILQSPSTGLITGKYLIQNLKGDVIDTWVAWYVAEGEPLHVSIVNSDLLPKDKIDAIKNAITSEESIEIKNTLLGKNPPELTATYYKGWAGAMKKAGEKDTFFYIPRDFEIIDTTEPAGDIMIILSTLHDSNGELAFTRSIADSEEHQILKSFITIFNVENLDNEELSAITRHEFGHALGLAHSSATEDLMYSKFRTDYPFISQCDIDAIISLYDNQKTNQVTCQN